jgi:hypothetical protein
VSETGAAPQAPGPEWAFNPPPDWGAPAGFDPRRGYVADPSWPPAPPGWAFWVKPVVPRAAKDNLFKRIGIWRIVIGVAAVIFLITRFTSHGAATDTGSCWTHASGAAYKPVSCSSSSATLRVTSETADPSTCPDNGAGYLDSKKDGSTRYRCLEPVTH